MLHATNLGKLPEKMRHLNKFPNKTEQTAEATVNSSATAR